MHGAVAKVQDPALGVTDPHVAGLGPRMQVHPIPDNCPTQEAIVYSNISLTTVLNLSRDCQSNLQPPPEPSTNSCHEQLLSELTWTPLTVTTHQLRTVTMGAHSLFHKLAEMKAEERL
ncbi:hypothetical protein TURU_151326 [Turdus rufiventris]|nr:hypothetical protein TURU_151326 [Turdus rufiventris]